MSSVKEKKMPSRSFIFSDNKSDRVRRHVLFWFCYWFYFTFFHAIGSGPPQLSNFRNIPYSTWEAFHLLLPQIFFTYVLIDFILPRFILNNRPVLSFFWIAFFLCVTAVLSFILLNYVFAKFTVNFLPEEYRLKKPRTLKGNILLVRVVTLKGTVMVAMAACSIRLVKYWHQKEKKNLELLKEKTEAQLQLLTAQLQPNFLFNTLKNIDSKVKHESPGSSKMISQLSHILHYVLHEGNQPLVPLESELKMITDYINLEKIRYDEKLNLQVSLPSNAENIYIAPLLILPFVENCFKHGASKMHKNPWIHLIIELQGQSLFLNIRNGKKKIVPQDNDRKGTGIANVKKRLDLLYEDRYALTIKEDDEAFVVDLVMELVRAKPTPSISLKSIPSTTAYA